MKSLPLYPNKNTALDSVTPLENNNACTLCHLKETNSEGARCVPAAGSPGDILVVLPSPSKHEKVNMQAGIGIIPQKIDKLIKAAGRTAVYAYAVSCFVGDSTMADNLDAIKACRSYLKAVIEETKPVTILAVGRMAYMSLIDDAPDDDAVVGGYHWFGDIPIFLIQETWDWTINRLKARQLVDNIQAAVSSVTDRLTDARNLQYGVVEHESDIELVVSAFSANKVLALDVETSGKMYEDDFRVECLAISNGVDTFVFPRESFSYFGFAELLISYGFTTWNGQYDWNAIAADAVFTEKLNLWSDGRLKRKLLMAHLPADLATSAYSVGMGGHKREQIAAMEPILKALSSWHKSKTSKRPKAYDTTIVNNENTPAIWFKYIDDKHDLEMLAHRYVPHDIEYRYVARDACATALLEKKYDAELQTDPDLYRVWNEVTQPAMWAWMWATHFGFPVDKTALSNFIEQVDKEQVEVLNEIHQHCPGLNPNSPQQLGAFLEQSGIKSNRKTASGKPSYDATQLEALGSKHPVIPLVQVYRELSKQKGTYGEGILRYLCKDGRVHPSYLLDGAETGRPSSRGPNMFNITKGRNPRLKRLGNMLRECFVAPDGWKIIEVDMAQIEIRELAYLTGDPDMKAIIQSGADFHMASARKFAEAQGKNPDDVTPMDRDNAKTTVFAAAYEIPTELGYMLSKRLNVEPKVGTKLANTMFVAYKRVRPWMNEMYIKAWESGYARTTWNGRPGRKRFLYGMGSNPPTLDDLERYLQSSRGDQNRRKQLDLNAARSTWNGPNQGSAVDLVSSSLWPIQCWLNENTNGGQFVLQIYDSVMLLVRDEDVDKAYAHLNTILRRPLLGDIPLDTDGKIGQSWGTLKKKTSA